jgi:CBS domain-containing protein
LRKVRGTQYDLGRAEFARHSTSGSAIGIQVKFDWPKKPEIQTSPQHLSSVNLSRRKFGEIAMKVSNVMTSNVQVASPDHTVEQAAWIMGEIDAGILPIAENDRLIGMVTDRDIAVRCVAKGMGPDTKVREVLSDQVKYCFEDQDIKEVSANMAEIQVRRLPVLDRSKRLVGIVSLGDIAMMEMIIEAGEALSGISQPGGRHSQNG